MSEDSLRFDELEGSWVGLVPSRRTMQRSTHRQELPKIRIRCPFCPGHEADTEATVAQWPSEGVWQARVVQNKYPLVRSTATTVPPHAIAAAMPNVGRHEVIIEAREHDIDLWELGIDHLAGVLRLYRDRAKALGAAPDAEHVVLFRNRGTRAGSSQPHPHAQVASVPVVGPRVALREARAEAHYRAGKGNLLKTLVDRELEEEVRVVETTERFVVFCPYAPHQPNEVWIVARDPVGSFTDRNDATVDALAPVFQRTIERLIRVLRRPAYNISFVLPPRRASRPGSYWLIMLLPRGKGGAGFELTSGIDLVTVTPEEAAAALRGEP
ncbi:MAG: hypothetical protein AAGF12_01955 [Myxococcota bacterium]